MVFNPLIKFQGVDDKLSTINEIQTHEAVKDYLQEKYRNVYTS